MTLDEHLPGAFEKLADRVRDEIARELRDAAADLATEAKAERDAAVEEGATRARAEAEQRTNAQLLSAASEAEARAREADLVASERLLEAIHEIDRARSLTEILDTLVSCTGREVTRVGLLLVRGPELHGWRFIGFGPAFESAPSIIVRSEDSGIIAEAIRTGAAVLADPTGQLCAPGFAQLPIGRESLAVPVAVSGDVVGVLYADRGESNETEKLPVAVTWSGTLELLALHAARCLEALTAITAVRVLTDSSQSRFGPASTAPENADEDSSRDGAEAAGRYARLLVSEIKLYHESAVAAGRRERDLSTRLEGEIARARLLYEQRVPIETRGHTDYFHDELVRTLAEGDASLLNRS
jgi:hypothetical protein